MGVNRDGQREILGCWVGDSASEATWRMACHDLTARGHGVDLVVSDHRAGLVHAPQQEFQEASRQRCPTHCTRNVLASCPKAVHDSFHSALRAVFDAPGRSGALIGSGVLMEQHKAWSPGGGM